MGIDYYSCHRCEESFPDVVDYVYCECGIHWCSEECAEEDGFREEPYGYTPKDSNYEHDTSCKYCREDDFEDGNLLEYALKVLNVSREHLITLYKQSK